MKYFIASTTLLYSCFIQICAISAGSSRLKINYKQLFSTQDKLTKRRALTKSAVVENNKKEVVVKKQQQQQQQQPHQLKRILESRIKPYLKKGAVVGNTEKARRSLDREVPEDSCDYAFIKCLSQESCIKCFQDLEDEGVNWAGISLNTPCQDVIKLLNENNHCMHLADNGKELDTFCSTFNVCAVWEDDDEYYEDANKEEDELTDDFFPDVDCDSLKQCEWDGMHSYFIGDGVCHDFGCYNSKICNYDGGDCCADTCNHSSPYFECGQDHFWCRDPNSKNCNSDLTKECPDYNDTISDKPVPACVGSEEVYQLNQYDTFGDGWGITELSIKRRDSGIKIYKGALSAGYEGFEYLCLDAGCYAVTATGGVWGNEVSWELNRGSATIAEGGSPMECTFPIGGAFCEQTCDGKNSENAVWEDDSWQSYSDLETCLETSCVIQLGICKKDEQGCLPCLIDDDPPSFCYTNDNYNALVDCSICNCSDEKPDYCTDNGAGNKDSYQSCTSPQTLAGASAIFEYSKCSNIDGVEAMIADWDDNHFGALDKFEECSHTFATQYANGGKTALDCLRILKSTIDSTSEKKAVVDIANDLYTNGEGFCNCASESHKKTPPCKDFMHFKVLLWESLDACVALDEIDCSAWSEFYEPCKRKMLDKFSNTNFSNQEQCQFIHDGCDGVGPFPSFRRLDCGKEISKAAWDFYMSYQRGCLTDNNGGSPTSPNPAPTAPVPSPVAPSSPVAPAPTQPQPLPTPGQPTKPYIPSDDDLPAPSKNSSYSSTSGGSKLKWIVIVSSMSAIVYVVYKRRQANASTFSYVQYQRQRNNVDYESDLNTRLSDTIGFEPPTLPPAPGDLTQS